jgi:aspartate kinase
MAMAIDAAGHKAISFTGGQVGLVTDESHTKARIKKIDADRIHRELKAGRIVIVAGFQGITEDGAITTLGRGGSDTTAVALAAALKATACEIYTDVDGVYTTDPRIVPEARKIDRISYDEMLELASLGAGVMHSRAIEFGKKYDVPIHVRSSLTDAPGTLIISETPEMEGIVVRGATMKKDLARVMLIGVPNKPGIAARIFARIAKHNIAVDDIIQNVYQDTNVANIGFTVAATDAAEAQAVCQEIGRELGFNKVELEEEVARVSVVGVGMKTHTGVAAKMFSALADAKVNIGNISTSEIVISCIVDRADAEKALKAVHAAFELDKA